MPTQRDWRLYSYVLRYDFGSAPNPFCGTCTLVICKPGIRLHAQQGDWIVGTGSADSPLGDKRGYLVYAMKVTRPKLTLAEYDDWAQQHCIGKLPDPAHDKLERRCGDAIYEFAGGRPRQRKSVHGASEKKNDLSGKYALLSDHFYYFGCEPIPLPPRFRKICHPYSGERWRPNEILKVAFIDWLEGLGFKPNIVHALPARPLERIAACSGVSGGCNPKSSWRKPRNQNSC